MSTMTKRSYQKYSCSAVKSHSNCCHCSETPKNKHKFPFKGCNIDLNSDLIIEIMKYDAILFQRLKSTCKLFNTECHNENYYQRLYNLYCSKSTLIDFEDSSKNDKQPKFTTWYDAFKLCFSLDTLGKIVNKFNRSGMGFLNQDTFYENRLQLSYQKIEIIPATINVLINLKSIRMESCGINVIPEQLCDLIDLENINLADNHINIIPKEISFLRKLTILSLNRNEIKSLPSEFYTLTNLTELNLRHNQIESISPDIQLFKRLKILYISNNKLLSIPDEIGELANLCSLDITVNKITCLPIQINQLTNLSLFEYDKRLIKNKVQQRFFVKPL